MNIRDALAEKHSASQTRKIIKYIGSDAARFGQLMKIFLSDDYRFVQRASNAVNDLAGQQPKLVEPYLPTLISELERLALPVAQKRNFLRLLQYIDVPEKMAGVLFSHCLELIGNPADPVAVRSFAILAAARIASRDESLLRELRLITSHALAYTSNCGFRKDARKIGVIQG